MCPPAPAWPALTAPRGTAWLPSAQKPSPGSYKPVQIQNLAYMLEKQGVVHMGPGREQEQSNAGAPFGQVV